MLVDATSPVEATRAFRRRTVRDRMRRVADVWLARTLVLEDEHTEVTYLWTQSHTELKCEKAVGSYLPNAAADLMCELAEEKGDTPAEAPVVRDSVPHRQVRHRVISDHTRGQTSGGRGSTCSARP